MVEKHLPHMCEVLGSVPSTANEEEKGGREEGQTGKRGRKGGKMFGSVTPTHPNRVERTAHSWD